ncbi:MAG: YigZ family protein [Lachnospiraceae bacterium]|nr:YigZ family protein [Lachnospiraceae bacterium]
MGYGRKAAGLKPEETRTAYRVVAAGGTAEITEKKSRFIATVQPVHSQEEAAAFVESMRKKYWDATHNCSAYVIGRQGEIKRSSDDGEPSGTAGRPMLEVLLAQELCDVAVVVTRYFGGTLLGTGGLIRAYGRAVQEGLAASRISTMTPMILIRLGMEYSFVGKIKAVLAREEAVVLEESYTDSVAMNVAVVDEKKEQLLKELTEATGGRIETEEKEMTYLAL